MKVKKRFKQIFNAISIFLVINVHNSIINSQFDILYRLLFFQIVHSIVYSLICQTRIMPISNSFFQLIRDVLARTFVNSN